MKNKLLIPTVLFCIVAVFSIYLLTNKKDTTIVQNVKVNNVILFYGDGCPHCALVEKFVSENGIETKVSFDKKEVYYNKQNASELAEKAKLCDMPIDSIGVPFLWDGTKCVVGDQPIIDFFKQKANE